MAVCRRLCRYRCNGVYAWQVWFVGGDVVYIKKSSLRALYIATILVVYVLLVACLMFGRQPIKNATVADLERIDGIGLETAVQIAYYIQANPNCHVDDLINVKWVGEERLKLIKEKYK